MLLQTFPHLRKYRHGSKFLWPEHDQEWTGLLGAARVPGRGHFFLADSMSHSMGLFKI